MNKQCYIKPTRFKHSSGFRTFEVGYILKMADNKVVEKEILTTGADHIYQDYSGLYDPTKAFGINMDLTTDGYIRIWEAGKHKVRWGGSFPSSDMELTIEEQL